MQQAVDTLPHLHGNEISEELRSVLISLGRGLGTVSVYGMGHPSVELIVDKTFEDLHTALQGRKSIAIGTFNGTLTIDDQPVITRDIPIRTLEKRLVSMKVSHLALSNGLTRNELKKLLNALCVPGELQLKEILSTAGLDHVEMTDVKYVALRDGEQKISKEGGEKRTDNRPGSDASEIPPSKITQIVAFLKGKATGEEASENIKNMLSDPERLGQMIMEAAAVRQSAVIAQDGESLADIVIGCLRRTYGSLRKETEFQSPRGKINLTKAMMLLEKNVLDKVHASLGAQHPEIDRRIFDAVREMEEEQQFEMLTAHYFDQRRKLDKAELKMIEGIKKHGAEKSSEQLGASDIPPRDWQRLIVKAEAAPDQFNEPDPRNNLNLSALAVVLENLEGLMQITGSDSEEVQHAVGATRNGFETYADGVEKRVQELEAQIEMRKRHPVTAEDHAEYLDRDELMIEVSKLTLALLQPLTVVNASIEAAQRHVEQPIQKDLLDLAYESGTRMQSLTKRLMTLVGYPMLKG
jgi:hypothetical protein